jgi:hypothetical protein
MSEETHQKSPHTLFIILQAPAAQMKAISEIIETTKAKIGANQT